METHFNAIPQPSTQMWPSLDPCRPSVQWDEKDEVDDDGDDDRRAPLSRMTLLGGALVQSAKGRQRRHETILYVHGDQASIVGAKRSGYVHYARALSLLPTRSTQRHTWTRVAAQTHAGEADCWVARILVTAK